MTHTKHATAAMVPLLILSGCGSGVLTRPESEPAAVEAISRASGAALQADMPSALATLSNVPGEHFRGNVTFLGHEAQHFAYLKRWPAMAPWLLEYRAKLVELAGADTTLQDVLRRFYESQGDDATNQPHAFANRKVIADLGARLGSDGQLADLRKIDSTALRAAARALLIEDTRLRLGAPLPLSQPP